ncbi:MAG: hypothetical protein A2X18_03855 [Bacteroidetes bacterium GWF2_40_14]|jgi:HAD superfamily hydrolase (TIGR01549 family)|nr:MAG: hypothetical protein A2X18_03855 [Bacteroidetes bacterium GWF2_40_14]
MVYAIIFDMDGVVIDSNPYHKIGWTRFFNKKGVEVNDEIFKNLIFGTTGDEALKILLQKDLTQEEIDNYSYEIDEEYRNIIRQLSCVSPVTGLVDFLKSIKLSGHKIALATSAPSENVDLILKKLGIYEFFDLIVDKTQILRGKPNPEIYNTTVSKLSVDKGNCVVFEDSISGIMSASGAGITVIGVETSHSSDELIQAGASLTICDFSGMTIALMTELIMGKSIKK